MSNSLNSNKNSLAYAKGWNKNMVGGLIFSNPFIGPEMGNEYREWKSGFTQCEQQWEDGEAPQPRMLVEVV